MRVAAWNNGAFVSTGAGYGIRVQLVDRDRHFDRSWKEIFLDLPDGSTSLRVKLSGAFWRDCPELRSAQIGRWLIAAGHRRWPRGTPPVFTLSKVKGDHFRVA